MKAITKLTLSAAAVVAVGFASNLASATATPPVEGKVTGKVKYEGKKPEMKPLAITADQAKGCCPPGKEVNSQDQSLLIGAGDGIKNVVVMVQVEGAEVKPAA